MERAPVDRDRDARPQQRGRLGRALGVHVARAERRAPAGHRQQRDVERRRAPPSRRRGRCRPRSRPTGASPITKPSGSASGPRSGRRSRVVVSARTASTRDAAHVGRLARLELLDLEARRAGAARPAPRGAITRGRPRRAAAATAGRGGRGAGARSGPRRSAARRRRRRAVAPQVSDPRAQHRVGQQAHAAELDEHGGVADVGDAAAWRRARSSARPGASPHHPDWVIPGHPSGSRIAHMRGRRIGVDALLVLGTLLWTALGFAVWANRQALDTDNWVDTSSALLEDDEIRTARGPVHHRPALPERRGRRRSSSRGASAAARPARQAGRRRAQAGRAAERRARARHRCRAPGLGDRQPDRAPDAAAHHRERRGERRRLARPGSLFEQMATATGLPRTPSTSCPRRCRRSRSRAATSSRPRGTRSTSSRRSCGSCSGSRSGAFAGSDRAVARPAPDGRHGRRLPHVRGHRPVRDPHGSAAPLVVDALADAPNAHAVADDVWAIATSLLVDAAEGSFLFGLFLVARRLARGRRAPRDRDPARSAYSMREHPGLVRAGLGAGDPAARDLGAGAVDAEALGDRDLHRPRVPLARARSGGSPSSSSRTSEPRAPHCRDDATRAEA